MFTLFKIDWKNNKNKKLFYLDIIILILALINFFFFAFDYTYLKFRNVYFHYGHAITKYDVVKGIEPHKDTDNYIKKADYFFSKINVINADRKKLEDEMINLSLQMLKEQPFDRANKQGDLQIIKDRMKKYMRTNSSEQAFTSFWKISAINTLESKHFFDSRIRRIVETNYWRAYDETGNYVDYYIYIDSFFVIIFLLEFLSMWIFAIKRDADQKVLYPVYHFYDWLSCIPLDSFRILRFIRVVVIYMRLLNEGVISKDDLFYRGFNKYINPYKEMVSNDISAKVTMNILNDAQEKIRLGVNKEILEHTISPQKDRIRKVVVENLKKVQIRIANENKNEIVNFLSKVIDDTLDGMPQYQSMIRIPYVGDKIQKALSEENINKLVNQSSQSFSNSFNTALETDLGKSLLNNIVEDLLDEVIVILKHKDIQSLIQDFNIEFVEELKKGTVVKLRKGEFKTPLIDKR